MTRLSDRISAAMATVKCPACGDRVIPMPGGGGEEEPTGKGGRWSYIWLPPSGDVCPNCKFPIDRYARRAKWMRLVTIGIVSVTVGVGFQVIALMGEAGSVVRGLRSALLLLGGLSLLVGFVGVVIGGRRDQNRFE